MSHDWHENLPGYNPDHILHDGCNECEQRSARRDHGISSLDPANFRRAWARAAQWNEQGLPSISDAETPLLDVLWAVQVQLQHRGAFGVSHL